MEACQSAPLSMELPAWSLIRAPLMFRKILCIIAVGDIRYKNLFRAAVVVFHLHCHRCQPDRQWQTLGQDQREVRANNTVLGTVLYTGSPYSKGKT